MSLLTDLTIALNALAIPVETGVFTDKAPDAYVVILPMTAAFAIHADNTPGMDVQEARLSIFTKGSYTALKNRIVRKLLDVGITITARQYIGYDTETGYHHYNVDAANYYELEEE